MLLNNQWATDDTKEEIKKIPGNTESGNTAIQNHWDAAVRREKYGIIQAYLRKQEKSEINNLTLYLK